MEEVVKTVETELEEAARRAAFRLGQFFKRVTHEETERTEAHIAKSVIATWVKNRQAQIGDRALTVAVAKELGLSKEQFALVVKETMPQLGVVRLLTGGVALPIEEENLKLKEDNVRLSEVAVNLQRQLAEPR